MNLEKSFTLIELLIVIGILAILATVVIIVINPTELLKQARDSNRLSDLGTLNTGLLVAQTQSISFFGTSSIVYISISDSTSTCANLGLPTLPSGWSYNCVPSSTLTKVDGNGWVPVNFTQMTIGVPFSNLPIDPINTTTSQEYYTYVVGGSWEMTAELESDKYSVKAINDGDSYPGVYSLRTSASTLTPGTRDKGMVGYWKLDEGSGTTAYDSSGNGNNGTWNGTGTHYATGKFGAYAGQLNGTDDWVNAGNAASLGNLTTFTIALWVKRNANPPIAFEMVSKGDGQLRFYFDTQSVSLHRNHTTTGANAYAPFSYAPIGQWTQVVATLDNNKVASLYSNGNEVGYSSRTTGVGTITNDASTPLKIGQVNGSYYFNGLIDDVRIYNRALSAAEISAIYNATK